MGKTSKDFWGKDSIFTSSRNSEKTNKQSAIQEQLQTTELNVPDTRRSYRIARRWISTLPLPLPISLGRLRRGGTDRWLGRAYHNAGRQFSNPGAAKACQIGPLLHSGHPVWGDGRPLGCWWRNWEMCFSGRPSDGFGSLRSCREIHHPLVSALPVIVRGERQREAQYCVVDKPHEWSACLWETVKATVNTNWTAIYLSKFQSEMLRWKRDKQPIYCKTGSRNKPTKY